MRKFPPHDDRSTRLAAVFATALKLAETRAAMAHVLAKEYSGVGYGKGRSFDGTFGTTRVDADGYPIMAQDGATADTAVSEVEGKKDAMRHAWNNLKFLEDTAYDIVVAWCHHVTDLSQYASGDAEPGEHVDRPSVVGECLACDRYVAGTASDRLRAGLCDADRKHWERHRGEHADRQAWLISRRAELAEKEEVQHIDPTDPRSAA